MPQIRLGDLDVSYELTGSGVPVVLVHGLGSSGRDWEWQVPALEGSYRVLTYDVRGRRQQNEHLHDSFYTRVFGERRKFEYEPDA